jgi:hypothetical protein
MMRASYRVFFAEQYIKVVQSRGGHVACVRKMRNVYKISAGKSEGNRPFGRRKCRWRDNTKMYYKETGLESVDYFYVAWVGVICWAARNTITKLRFLKLKGIF